MKFFIAGRLPAVARSCLRCFWTSPADRAACATPCSDDLRSLIERRNGLAEKPTALEILLSARREATLYRLNTYCVVSQTVNQTAIAYNRYPWMLVFKIRSHLGLPSGLS